MADLYIGLMSGTSGDGIDAAVVDFGATQPRLIDFTCLPFPPDIRPELSRLTSTRESISLKDYGTLDSRLGHLFATAVNHLLAQAGLPATAIMAIGSHGHTMYHAPDLQPPFSLQIGDPNIIAQTTGITTVADFRRRDIAAQGQGAPLAPAFHHACFADTEENRVVANIGGIANITALPKNDLKPPTGFDTGPGNTLMNQWIGQHKAAEYDKDGAWAHSGRRQQKLLEALKADPYFAEDAPKSTGREYFSLHWLQQKLSRLTATCSPQDIQAGLCHLTAETLCEAIRRYAPETERVLVCGGGVHNKFLMTLIRQLMDCPVESTENYGVHPDHVEAIAFAWLARQTINFRPGNLTSVTGAVTPTILGGIYPVKPLPGYQAEKT